jgi:hypothetical protein
MKGIAAVSIGICLAAFASARPDRNAFLNDGANSLKEVIAQAKRDPEVMDRYRRHFGMSSTEVVAYLSSLRPGRLTKGGAYQVYSVPPAGFIKSHVQKFKLGTAVYIDAYNRPAMIALCGNPLTVGPKENIATSDISAEVTDLPVSEQREIMDSSISTPMVEEAVALRTPSTGPLDPGPLTAGSSPIVVAPAFGLGNLLLGLLGVGGATTGLISLTNGGGGDSTVVPEPATLLVAGAGAAYLIRRRRRKQG